MIIGRRRWVLLTQRPPDGLLELVGVVHALVERLGERVDDRLPDLVEGGVVLGEATCMDLRAADDLAGLGVHDHDHRHEPLLAEDPAVLQAALGDVPDGLAVDEHVAAVDLADDLGLPVDQVDHDAVLGEHDPVGGHARGDRQVGVGLHVPELAVHRHHVARLDDVVAVEQLAGTGVAADVHQRVALVHHPGAATDEAVDHPRMTVSPSSRDTKLWLRWAIRLSAESGSPCEPVQISTTLSDGMSASALASTSRPGGTLR